MGGVNVLHICTLNKFTIVELIRSASYAFLHHVQLLSFSYRIHVFPRKFRQVTWIPAVYQDNSVADLILQSGFKRLLFRDAPLMLRHCNVVALILQSNSLITITLNRTIYYVYGADCLLIFSLESFPIIGWQITKNE